MHDYIDLKVHAEALNDLERLRISMENRYRSLTTSGISEDGHHWGLGLDPESPTVKAYADMVEQITKTEQAAIKIVQKTVKTSPLGEFVKQAKGVGEKQAARLLAAIGDPYWHVVEDRPRTVGELWAYCGYDVRDGKAPKRAKGQQGNWNSDARMRAHLVAKSVEKQTSGKYREVYDETKKKYAGSVHQSDCPQCHAKAGDPLKPGHIQSRALRKVAKEILKDMWKASRDYHEKKNSDLAA